jgi:hypothetical protein
MVQELAQWQVFTTGFCNFVFRYVTMEAIDSQGYSSSLHPVKISNVAGVTLLDTQC